ncbi:MAG: hypothetical protein R3331_10225 [Sulfurospirillaceae bacterium]|nr:hypothetical protein [Sulfurospirillaceae bacterium]
MDLGRAQFYPIDSNVTKEGIAKNRKVKPSFFMIIDTENSIAQKSILDIKKQQG